MATQSPPTDRRLRGLERRSRDSLARWCVCRTCDLRWRWGPSATEWQPPFDGSCPPHRQRGRETRA